MNDLKKSFLVGGKVNSLWINPKTKRIIVQINGHYRRLISF